MDKYRGQKHSFVSQGHGLTQPHHHHWGTMTFRTRSSWPNSFKQQLVADHSSSTLRHLKTIISVKHLYPLLDSSLTKAVFIAHFPRLALDFPRRELIYFNFFSFFWEGLCYLTKSGEMRRAPKYVLSLSLQSSVLGSFVPNWILGSEYKYFINM